MADPEYFIKGESVPNLPNTVLIEVQNSVATLPRRTKKSGQIVHKVTAQDVPIALEQYRNKASIVRVFVRGVDETPELVKRMDDWRSELGRHAESLKGR